MTTHVLRIDSSVRNDDSVSRALTTRIIERLAPKKITTRDLANSLPLIDATWIGANFTPADDRTDDQRETLALSDALIAEVKAADTLVIGLPIYNFGTPAGFKAWVDMIARAGVTFKYSEQGPVGLLEGKRAILAVASGGTEVGSAYDHATTYARQVLGFVGITDVTIVAADRLMVDADASHKAANEQIAALAA
ncbi:FMN-dependent NADH-azoreductase [Puniceibacterium sp. IMCC21224]|uniref:FMN-dependent NADH-azoreductase n=1 Tax=Puniceibacterium sp. IMCC21224 TaxID=1618204 RepID=UPI00064D8FF9|nr:NAD(P)H-dependent oxidoreductase [Puniceibacterium sp. IMCC21224]KMK68752.1 acyl carrier protein phosphodiesterase [Puniceibacterium sp. IMCC21224]